jgi:choline dehydrogenase
MWDHIDIEVTYKVGVVGFNTIKNQTYNQEQLDAYRTIPAKSMYGSYGADYIGWEKLPADYRANTSSTTRDALATFPSDWPEIEYEVASIYTSTDPEDFNGYGTFVVVPVSPLSRGLVSLLSNSMLDPPVIDPQWLTNPADVELALLPPGQPISTVYGLAEKISAEMIASR